MNMTDFTRDRSLDEAQQNPGSGRRPALRFASCGLRAIRACGLLSGAILVTAILSAAPAAAQKIKVGYWSSGVSVGFGAVMRAGKFLEKQGLEPELIEFADVTGPPKAMLTGSIDATFGAPTTTSLTLGIQGAPIDILLASQIAEADIVVKEGSPIKAVADLKGKKVGMSPVGSAMYAIVSAVMDKNYGVKSTEFTPVGGNEGRLVQFLEQGDVEAAALRTVTLASVPDLKLTRLGVIVDEWKKMTKGTAPPTLGTALMLRDYRTKNPQAAVKFVKAIMEVTKFGVTNPAEATEMLKKASNLDAKDATAYVKVWGNIYEATMEPADIATFKVMADIFRAQKTIEGDVPDSVFVAGPYEAAKKLP